MSIWFVYVAQYLAEPQLEGLAGTQHPVALAPRQALDELIAGQIGGKHRNHRVLGGTAKARIGTRAARSAPDGAILSVQIPGVCAICNVGRHPAQQRDSLRRELIRAVPHRLRPQPG